MSEKPSASFVGRAARVTAALVLAAITAACSQKPPIGQQLAGDGYDGRGRGGANGIGYPMGGPVSPGTQRDFEVNVGKTVRFNTDSARIAPEARDILVKQAQWLKQYPKFTITVEGHADERGTREYNLGLAARRAQAVSRFLASQGIRQARIRTLSYGKERPVAVCNDISCWSQNRRGVTMLNKHG